MLSNWQAEPIMGLMRLIETQSKESLVNWAVGYAEANFLPIYTKHYPEDHRDRSLRWNTAVQFKWFC